MNNIEDVNLEIKLALEFINDAKEAYPVGRTRMNPSSGKAYYTCLTHIDIAIGYLERARHLMECDLEGREP